MIYTAQQGLLLLMLLLLGGGACFWCFNDQNLQDGWKLAFQTTGIEKSLKWQPAACAVGIWLQEQQAFTVEPTEGAAMDFSGTWTVYSEENLDEFLRVIGENILI